MAGSYNHVVKEDGNLESNEAVVDMLETGGDVFEAVEEMYGMIWWLARSLRACQMMNRVDAAQEKDIVELAQLNYKRGLEIAKEVNKS
jgi:hypothetical protein